jgi:hypothetical protein
MKVVKDYKVISAGVYFIDDAINRHILEGWQPIGGVSVAVEKGCYPACYQAMVMYESENYNDKKD